MFFLRMIYMCYYYPQYVHSFNFAINTSDPSMWYSKLIALTLLAQ